ncbi:MAG TPA: hypothetical protein VGH47_00815, partial [Xanthobacteraceae bacterium]
IAIAGIGFAIAAQLKSLKEYSDHMTDIGNAAQSLGVASGSLRNIEQAFERVGKTAGDARTVIGDIQKLQADLARPGSEIRFQLFQHAHSDEAIRNTELYLDRLDRAKTIEEKIEVIRQGGEGVYRANLQYGEQIARQREKEWLQIQHQSEAIIALQEKIRPMSPEERAAFEARRKHAQDFEKQSEALAQTWEHITDLWKDSAIVGLLATVKSIAEYGKIYADAMDKAQNAAEKTNKEIPSPENFWDRINPLDPVNRARSRRYFELQNDPAAPAHPLDIDPKVLEQYRSPMGGGVGPSLGGAAPQFFAGGGGDGGDGKKPFWEYWRPSTNIEDNRRGQFSGGQDSPGGQLAETNRQLKMLNDNLFEMLHPAGAVGGAPGGFGGGFGALGGGGGMPGAPGGGGLGGAGQISVPPYGSHVGPGTGAGAGETSPHGTLGGDAFDPFTRGAGGGGGAAPGGKGGNAWIAQQRAGFAKELQDPNVRTQVAAMLHSEDPTAGPAAVESLMNRAAFAHKTLSQMLHSGFYGPINRGELGGHIAALRRNPKLNAQMNRYIDQALAGSDVIKGHTDQGGPGDPNFAWERAHGGVMMGHEVYGDWLRGRGTTAWREAFERGAAGGAAADRTAMDSHAVQTHKVEATGKLTANINAPKGTDVTLEGGGAFSKIELNRQTQMQPARTGPVASDYSTP